MLLAIVVASMFLLMYLAVPAARLYSTLRQKSANILIVILLFAALCRQIIVLTAVLRGGYHGHMALAGESIILILIVMGICFLHAVVSTNDGVEPTRELEQLFNHLPLAMIVLGHNGTPVFINDEIVRISGHTREEIDERPEIIQSLIPTGDMQYSESDSITGRDDAMEVTHSSVTSRAILWPNAAAPIPVQGWGHLVVGVDITGYQAMEHNNRTYHDQLEDIVFERSRDLTAVNKALEKQISMQEIMERHLAGLNEAFLSFGDDPETNIELLVSTLGTLLGAYSVCYSRLYDGVLTPITRWGGFMEVGGGCTSHLDICVDVIRRQESNAIVIRDLSHSVYAETNSMIRLKRLETYLGAVVISGGERIGVLGVLLQHDIYPYHNEEWLLGVLTAAVAVEEGRLKSLMALRESEKRLKKSLLEKELLLREVHHRVKNNLQVISSLFDLYSMETDDSRTLRFFESARSKIHSMALIHNQLYRSSDIENIDIVDYTRDLFKYLLHSYADKQLSIRSDITGSRILLPLSKAIPLGIVLNELLTNSLEHGFERGETGNIDITFELVGTQPDRLMIVIGDNGRGLPQTLAFKSQESLGFKLVRTLVERQLGGSVTHHDDTGAVFDICIGMS